jgi:sRNA-binding carbon storage regulator CsrA
MLSLSRKTNEIIDIDIPEGFVVPRGGLRIEVMMLDYSKSRGAKLGISAPLEIAVNRREVSESKRIEGTRR